MDHKWTVHLGCFFLLLSLELPALCESRIKCPDGEMRIQMNVQDIAITYDGYSLSVAMGDFGLHSYGASFSPSQIQRVAAETQRTNEYAKVLIVSFNSCVISKKEFKEGLDRMSPRFEQNAFVSGEIVRAISQNRRLSASDRRLLVGISRRLEEIANMGRNNTDQILLAIDRTPQSEASGVQGLQHTNLIFETLTSSNVGSTNQIALDQALLSSLPNESVLSGPAPDVSMGHILAIGSGNFGSQGTLGTTNDGLFGASHLNNSLLSAVSHRY